MRILVTAGPTREFMDPVRYISNSSTGTFGYEIAKAALRRGHKVILISGPTRLIPPVGAKLIPVVTALEMKAAVDRFLPSADCLIMSAAVADYRPVKLIPKKIKKRERRLVIKLKRNPDILFEVGKRRGDKILVGFALETGNLVKNAKEKLKKKNLDLIIATETHKEDEPYGDRKVGVVAISRKGQLLRFRSNKKVIANFILDEIKKMCQN